MYEVLDSSLSDIKYALNPTFSDAQVAQLSSNKTLSTDILGVSYLPGYVGLNNLKMTDYINVAMQFLCHVEPLRNYFLNRDNYALCTSGEQFA